MSSELDRLWELPLTHPAVDCGPPQTGTMDDFLQPNYAPNFLVRGQIAVALLEEWHGQLPCIIRHSRLPPDGAQQGQDGPVDDDRLQSFAHADQLRDGMLVAHLERP